MFNVNENDLLMLMADDDDDDETEHTLNDEMIVDYY